MTKQQRKSPDSGLAIQAAIREGRYRYPGKLTPRFQREACELVRRGTPPTVALGALGVVKQTIWNWKQWAKSGEYGEKYAALWTALEGAWEEWKAYVATHVPGAVEKDSRMAVEVASRVMPEEYGKKDAVTTTYEIGPLLAQIAMAASRGELDNVTEGFRELPPPRE